jgi:hypothetical protein
MAKKSTNVSIMAVGQGGVPRLLAQMIINGQITYKVAIKRFPQIKEEIDWYLTWYGHPELIEEV